MPKLFNLGTNKQGLVVYGGESSADYGMVVSEAPAYERPARKQTSYSVPGKNGVILFQEDAWEDVPRVYNMWAAAGFDSLEEKVNAFEAVLNSQKGYVRLEDNFEPDFFRLAYYSGGDGFSNNMTQYGEAAITFTCRPEKFYKAGEFAIEVSNSDEIYNPTRYIAKPLIYIEGSGTVTIASGGNTISATLTDHMTIDCDAMNAYRLEYGDWGDYTSMNDKVSGAFPVLVPGANTIGITGTVTKVTIKPRHYTI